MSRKSRKITETRTPSPSAGAERSEAEAEGEGVRRGRPGRRTAEERTTAVLELLGGKATARPAGVPLRRPGVDDRGVAPGGPRRDRAVDAPGDVQAPRTARPRARYADLEKSFTRVAMKHELLERAALRTALPARDVVAMSRTTSRGTASVELLCETFHLSRQAYYAARKAPAVPPPRRREAPRATTRRPRRPSRPSGASARPTSAWGVRKVWATPAPRAPRRVAQARLGPHGDARAPPAAGRIRNEERRGTVAVPTSNRRWATDLTTVWTRRTGSSPSCR